MSHTKRYILLLVVVLTLAVGVVAGFIISRNTIERQFVEYMKRGVGAPSNKFDATLQLINNYYVDTLSVDTLIERMMPELIGELDPHSAYIPARDMSGMNESLDGEFDGIGIVFNMATDTVIVLNVITSGPSAKAGILARDRIININDSLVAGRKISQNNIVSRLRGERGTTVKLGIERAGIEGLVEIEVTRDKIPIKSVTSSFMIAPKVGYIHLAQFSRNTYKEFMSAIERLQSEGMESVIFDLRSNSGGFMDQAIHLANEFLPKGSLIVYTKDRTGHEERQYSTRSGALQDIPVAVLIDEGSASSSEILAGALQDNDRGVIIGRRSFGKGLVQQQIPFSDGSALRLTIARYYTPTGRSIQKPYELGQGEEYERELVRRIEHEELFTADSISFADSLRFVTPKGKIVYGGGGIMPDIFIPIKRDSLPKFYLEVAGRNVLYNYTIEYSDRHRDALAEVATLEDLRRVLDSDKSLVEDFVKYATSKGIESTPDEVAKAEKLLNLQLRAFIGRNTKLEDNGYYANIYELDDALVRAINELNSNTL